MNKEIAWRKLVKYIEDHPFTTMKIEFRDGTPYLAEEVKESIKFS